MYISIVECVASGWVTTWRTGTSRAPVMKSSTVAVIVRVFVAGSYVPRLIMAEVERLSRQIETYSFRKLS